MLKVGVIGLGVGEQHVKGFETSPLTLVHMICDMDQEKLNKIAKKYSIKNITLDWKEITDSDEIDIVVIASYDNFHAEQVERALQKGKHVFVEKPVCLTKAELNSLIKTHRGSPGLIVGSNLVLRAEPRFANLKKRISNGDLGQIYHINASYDYGRIDKLIYGWRGKIRNYSVFLGGGIHLVDLIRWILDENISFSSILQSDILSSQKDIPIPDFELHCGKTNKGVSVSIAANYGSCTPHMHQLSVYGTKGSFFNHLKEGTYTFGGDDQKIIEKCNMPCPSAPKYALVQEFINAILNRDNFEGLIEPPWELASNCLWNK